MLELSKIIADRIEGTPSRKSQAPAAHRSKFVLTTKDGQEVDMLPSRTEERAKGAAAAATPITGDDAMILGLTSTKALVRA